MDDKCIGQGIFREWREVGLGQQGLQSLEHFLLTGQALGVSKGRLVQGFPVGVNGVIQGLQPGQELMVVRQGTEVHMS